VTELWRTKLAAWLHDPPEKALVLMRTPGKGHEEGTVATLLAEVLGTSELRGDLEAVVRKADRMAAAADRPDRPGKKVGAHAVARAWDAVRFPEQPALVHPLSGDSIELGDLKDIAPEQAEALATGHLRACLDGSDGGADPRKAFLRLWRMAPELVDAPQIRSLWRLLPADTRVPDHSIWEHLGLVSALAGAMAGGKEEPCLLLLTLGPVQSFIEQGRTTSDLWAGSHLLARLAWEAMRPVVEECGPDALVFPALRGNPFCDAWLVEQGVLAVEELARIRRTWSRKSDAHPLFSASLPNRFLAIVPANRSVELASSCARAAREFARSMAHKAWKRVAEVAELDHDHAHAQKQIDAQLEGFPEVHWTTVRWPTAFEKGEGGAPSGRAGEDLAQALVALGAPDPREASWWKVLSRAVTLSNGAEFHAPNAGVLYPAVVELAERAQAAHRGARVFEQLPQTGYRCSLCGEREWLAGRLEVIRNPRGETSAAGNPWPSVAGRRPSWARGTEHLCALCTLKRLWPVLFTEEVKRSISGDPNLASMQRYVVSTHTMALVPLLERLSESPHLADEARNAVDEALDGAPQAVRDAARSTVAALPRRLTTGVAVNTLRAIPAALEAFDDAIDASRGDAARRRDLEERRAALEKKLADLVGVGRSETYYALLMVDGDRMGAWMSGGDVSTGVGRPPYGKLWHPEVREQVIRTFGNDANLRAYLDTSGVASPAYHAALSGALGDLSLHVFPYVVERIFHGKVVYAGGDDLLAMLPVHELLPAMVLLRAVYSGVAPGLDESLAWLLREHEIGEGLLVSNGYVLLDAKGRFQPREGRLFRTLGRRATCSMGAVVAHHTAPLQSVLAELRTAERRAKGWGRDAFSITLDKRGGGTTYLTGHFHARSDAAHPSGDAGSTGASEALRATPLGVLTDMQFLFEERVSRQGAYSAVAWLEPLSQVDTTGRALTEGSASVDAPMVADLLAYQWCRAAEFRAKDGDESETGASRAQHFGAIRDLAARVAGVARAEHPRDIAGYVIDMIRVAEFLAREHRRVRRRSAPSSTVAKGSSPTGVHPKGQSSMQAHSKGASPEGTARQEVGG
jgi:CRISPR-associated protein Cmr2